MKKALSILALCGLAIGMAACGEDSKTSCNNPALYVQSNNLKNALNSSTECKAQAEAISAYVDSNKQELDNAVTQWSDAKQANGFCYIRDAALYIIAYKNYKTVYTRLEECAQSQEEEAKTAANTAITGLTSVEGWNAMYETALVEAEKDANNNNAN